MASRVTHTLLLAPRQTVFATLPVRFDGETAFCVEPEPVDEPEPADEPGPVDEPDPADEPLGKLELPDDAGLPALALEPELPADPAFGTDAALPVPVPRSVVTGTAAWTWAGVQYARAALGSNAALDVEARLEAVSSEAEVATAFERNDDAVPGEAVEAAAPASTRAVARRVFRERARLFEMMLDMSLPFPGGLTLAAKMGST